VYGIFSKFICLPEGLEQGAYWWEGLEQGAYLWELAKFSTILGIGKDIVLGRIRTRCLLVGTSKISNTIILGRIQY